MAGDWIKMRTNLQRSPHVVRIASALKADRFRVIGALHAVWSLADEQTEDGFLSGYTFAVVDEMIGWEGFCAALFSVDWAREDASGVSFPRFEEHNGQSAKRRAQEADRKRSARASASPSASPSASDADKKRTREEKRRDKNNSAVALPDWVPAQAWADFKEHRKAVRKPLTNGAVKLLVAKLDTLRSQGHDPKALLELAIERGWQTVFPPNDNKPRASSLNDGVVG